MTKIFVFGVTEPTSAVIYDDTSRHTTYNINAKCILDRVKRITQIVNDDDKNKEETKYYEGN